MWIHKGIAVVIFEKMPDQNAISWNGLISAYAQNGDGKSTMRSFKEMIESGLSPDPVSFLCVLRACSHRGLVDEALQYFNSMTETCKLVPRKDHYASLVDVLCRRGRFTEAETIMAQMPFEPDEIMWSSVLNSCRIPKNQDFAKRAADELFNMDVLRDAAAYVTMSNIYDEAGDWQQVAKDSPLIEDIRKKINSLEKRMEEEGYRPDLSCSLQNVDDEIKVESLRYHSESSSLESERIMLQLGGILMGSKAFQFLNLFPIPTSRNYLQEISVNNLIIWRCFSGGRSGGSRWNLDANVNLNQRSRLSDAYLTEDCDDEGELGFKKKRVWWSDDFNGKNDDDDDEEEEEHGDVGFGVQEASISFKWISKVLRSFGWMIPAVITSLVLGTGTDSIFMALALPIAQSVFSLITETLWKRSSGASRTKSKSKKRTPARATSNSRPRKTKGRTTRTRPQKRAGDYTSWVASSNVSAETGTRNPRDFGGWDELDNQPKGR